MKKFMTCMVALMTACQAFAYTNLLSSLETEAQAGISAMNTTVVTVMVAVFAIVLTFCAFKLIKGAIKGR